MQVGCTKKLLDYLEQGSAPAEKGLNSFFSWSANLLTINHRKAIVLVNDASRCGIVLYGITAKERKRMDELLLQGVRAALEAECIDPKLIERYLADCGSEVTYTKTASRSTVARLNKFCQRVEWFKESMDGETLLQTVLSPVLNNDLIKVEKGYCAPYDLLANGFSKQYYTDSPYCCRAGVFDITLGLEPPCYRRLVIPLHCSFRQFHIALQCLFCWQDYHLHDFWLEQYPDGQLKDTLVCMPREEEYEGESTRMDTEVLLSEIFPAKKKIIYNYDFGDDWIHQIFLAEMIEDYRYNVPRCLMAMGDAPPEDVGGPGGFAEMLRVLADPKDPEHEGMKMWSDGMRWKPFDMEQTNRKLSYCLRWSME